MPIAAIDLDGLEQYVVVYYKDNNNKTESITVRTLSDNNGKLLNQHVHKIGSVDDIAKGNVLVFEAYKTKNNFDNFKIVQSRNTEKSTLTKEESGIYSKYKKLEKEYGETQKLGYGGAIADDSENQFESIEFNNADTRTYSADFGILPPPSTQKAPVSPPQVNQKPAVTTCYENFTSNISFHPSIATTMGFVESEIDKIESMVKGKSNYLITI